MPRRSAALGALTAVGVLLGGCSGTEEIAPVTVRRLSAEEACEKAMVTALRPVAQLLREGADALRVQRRAGPLPSACEDIDPPTRRRLYDRAAQRVRAGEKPAPRR